MINYERAFEGVEPKDEHATYSIEDWPEFERPRQVSTLEEFKAYVSRVRRSIEPPEDDSSSTADAPPEDTAQDIGEAVR